MATKPASPTQRFVPIKEIRDGVVTLKDSSYRRILICSSINFNLKSVDEQHAIITGFQNFLNTLDFSVQVVINSRRMDLRPYLALLAEKEKDQLSELMRIQLREYIEFIRSFTEQTNIMTKSFYVVVPYATGGINTGIMSGLFHTGHGSIKKKDGAADASFEQIRAQINQRVALVANALTNTGVRAVPLETEEVIELMYRTFNPGELENPIRLQD